mmetsp:Transcript_21324/g.30998  ORF Transcript_21324/g.30998 Transcript_21324/m.30998 type:complete len:198 (-) Transcript_21324:222-815(-)
MEVIRDMSREYEDLDPLYGFEVGEEYWALGEAENNKPGGLNAGGGNLFPENDRNEEWNTEMVTEDYASGDHSPEDACNSEEHSKDEVKKDVDWVRYKRKLRNRESAARSRRKHQSAIECLRKEVRELCDCSKGLLDRCQDCAMENARLKEENTKLFCQNTKLRLELFMMMVAKSTPELQKASSMYLTPRIPEMERVE